MKKREVRVITCIICPIGCKARVTIENGKISEIEDVECPRGEEYVTQERLKHPREISLQPSESEAPISQCYLYDQLNLSQKTR